MEKIKPTQQETEALIIKPLTADLGANLLFHAFRHGQGTPGLQTQFHRQIHRLYPEWKMPDSLLEETKQASRSKISRYVNAPTEKPIHVTASAEAISLEFEARAKDLQNALNAETPTGPLALQGLIDRLIIRDAEYVQDGRPRFKHESKIPQLDTRLSFFIHYGLQGNPTGSEEFDQIYKDVNDFFKTKKSANLDYEILDLIDFLLRSHNEDHPENPIQLPEIT